VRLTRPTNITYWLTYLLIYLLTKFCMLLDIRDIITYATFGDDRLRGSNFPFPPLTCVVALTTLSHYRASVWTIRELYWCYRLRISEWRQYRFTSASLSVAAAAAAAERWCDLSRDTSTETAVLAIVGHRVVYCYSSLIASLRTKNCVSDSRKFCWISCMLLPFTRRTTDSQI